MRLVCLVGLALVAGCSSEPDIIRRSKESLKTQVKDPEATQFKDVKICSANTKMVRGEYNAKNSFGAYGGFKIFYAVDGVVPGAQFVGDIAKAGKTYSYSYQLMLACYEGSDPDSTKFLADIEAGTALSVDEIREKLDKMWDRKESKTY